MSGVHAQTSPDAASAETLRRVAEVLGARGRELVDAAIVAARDLLGMELAFVSQLTADEQIYRYVSGDGSSFGLPQGHVSPQEHGYCVRMVDGEIPNVVPDVRADPRTSEIVATVACGVGAYVGVPLRLSDGQLYGSFCCLSHQAHPELGTAARGVMALLARLVGDELEREHAVRERQRLEIEAAASQALLAALDAREHYTGEHSRSVLDLALAVARALGLEPRELAEVGQVALLHDIGKVGVPDGVLQKPGALDDAELGLMRAHPAIGERIVRAVDGLAHIAPAVRAEHERWDGTGYPDGLAGDAIPLASRICLVCDAYDAMTTDRPYRRALDEPAALAELESGAGRQFDPRVVEVLLDVLRGVP